MTINVKPAGHRVIVLPDKLDDVNAKYLGETLKSIGLEIVHEGDKKRHENAIVTGTLVAIGATAWKAYDDGEPWAELGDRVYFSRHGGNLIEDPVTKEKYRLLNDEDIYAVILQ